ncbi:MAG: CoA transferase [Chitinophagaceae bacterium]|nr:MAG: CoA transferase [Chitinophagaceae bacterium]
MKLLEDILVLDFSQFLSAPSASLRLADMGARVIKIERPVTGDICRELYVSDTMVKGESTIFHAINRNKESFQADLKNANDLNAVRKLIKHADILIHNFRPGVMERIGLSYESVKELNPRLIYAYVNGYGDEGEWKDKPGQDLLLQAVSGITWLSGNDQDNPTPMGVAVADILAGTHLVQGILTAIYERLTSGKGALIEVSMLESLLDFQFEVLTCFYNDGNMLPRRSCINNGHAYIAAPYGIYKTNSGYLALSMGNIPQLGKLLGCDALLSFTDSTDWFNKRDKIKTILQDYLNNKSVTEWLDILGPADIWCAEVLNYDALVQEDGYKVLEMEQEVSIGNQFLKTTRCPIRVDGQILKSPMGAPRLGEHTESIKREFDL